MEQHEAAKVIGLLIAAFPDVKWGEDTVSVYEQAIAHLDFEVAKAAATRIAAASKFRPSIAELVGACVDVQHGVRKTGLEAWDELCRAIREFGAYRTPRFEDPKVQAAMEMIGGWRYVCLSENDMSDRARFVEAYEMQIERERVNVASGIELPSPREHQRLQQQRRRPEQLAGSVAGRVLGAMTGGHKAMT